jgi:hypothetical protein
MGKEGIFQARNKIGHAPKNDVESVEKSDASGPKVVMDNASSDHLEMVGPTGYGN